MEDSSRTLPRKAVEYPLTTHWNCYNRPAKVSGGIIGVTRKKDAVALWETIKHTQKKQYVDLLKKNNDVQGELSHHHDFSHSTAATIVKMAQDIKGYLLKVYNLLQDQTTLRNILTGENVTDVNINKLICYLKEGHEAYANFITD